MLVMPMLKYESMASKGFLSSRMTRWAGKRAQPYRSGQWVLTTHDLSSTRPSPCPAQQAASTTQVSTPRSQDRKSTDNHASQMLQ